MKKLPTPFDGLWVLENDCFFDERGSFQKLFNFDFFSENHLETDFKEFYYSVSKKDVIRGMHFQTPPHDHAKLVYVNGGSILDVVVDLRKGSGTYGRFFSIELKANDGKYLYIPKGFAHGFLALEDNSLVNYAQTTCYFATNDSGIRYDSFGFDWGIDSPILSMRDKSFIGFEGLATPFLSN